MKVFRKQPTDNLDYTLDFADWLPEGDAIFAIDEVTVPDGIEQTAFEVNNRNIRLWFTGGTDGEEYKIEATVSTNDGRVKQIEFLIAVVEI